MPEVGKKTDGFDSGTFEEQLRGAIRIFDADRFIPYKARIVLVKGDIEQTVPEFVRENPGLRICLSHFDVDLYRPTLVGLQYLWRLVVRVESCFSMSMAFRHGKVRAEQWMSFSLTKKSQSSG